MSFATFIISLAIISVITQFIFDRFVKKTFIVVPEDLEDSIFVVVSYKDHRWVQYVTELIERSYIPNRVFIGVLEYRFSPE